MVQIDERRRFTETVLAGVSAGVIGLDRLGRVDLPNRAASELMGHDLLTAVGLPLGEVVSEFAALLVEAQAAPDRARTAEVQIGPALKPPHIAGTHRQRDEGRGRERVCGDLR